MIAADRSGNVFVAGAALNSNQDADIAVVAYSTDGALLWQNVWASPWNDHDFPKAIALDQAGNVFVTGYSTVSGSPTDSSTWDWDYVTLAYSNKGEALWTNIYSGPGLLDNPGGIAVDATGNVLVTGVSDNSGSNTNYEIDTIKYSGAGVPLWTNRTAAGLLWRYSGTDIAVDGNGNVFVTGGDGIVAYSSAGDLLWTNRIPDLIAPAASLIALDTKGKVFVSSGFATMALSGAGVPLWTNRYRGKAYNASSAIAVDSSGNVIVTGASGSSQYLGDRTVDYATVAYSNAGVPLWTNQYNGPGRNYDAPIGVAVDASGNVFVTGSSRSRPANVDQADWQAYHSTDIATLAYSSTGAPLWTNRFNGPLNDADGAGGVVVDGAGNVFLTGSVDGLGGVTTKFSSSVRPALDIQRFDNQLVLSWGSPGFSLQSAPLVTGPFTSIPGGTSPYTNSIGSAQQGARFFRLRMN
jgi:hypothetical protein